MPNSHGRFVWHELSTSDPAAAIAFYTKLTPWTAAPSEMAADYTLLINDGTPVGGVTALEADQAARGVPPNWLAYVSVYDVDACVRQVPRLGGTIHVGPTEVPQVGCWAIFGDPFGATIGMFEPGGPRPGHGGAARRGEFSWH
jgi:predicted enzyme related to lactoylglutathione lyase